MERGGAATALGSRTARASLSPAFAPIFSV